MTRPKSPRKGRPEAPAPAAPRPRKGRAAKGATPEAQTKAAKVLAALQQPAGASVPELMSTTGWQAHSVRGFLSGTVRRRLGLKLLAEGPVGSRRYRLNP